MKIKSISNLLGFLVFTALTSCHSSHTGLNSHSHKQLTGDDTKIDLPVSEGIKDNFRNFVKLGYQKGDKVNDITLFTSDGTKFSLSEMLASNKPILLISGSYTCDISRRNMLDIKLLSTRYKSKINSYLVYTIDAHPSDVASPYSTNNRIDIASANIRDHIEAQQAKTYGERKLLARKWQQQNGIAVPVLVDTPANDFWLAFGQAPNMAYLINPDGTVYYKQVWFKFPDLDDSIKSWLRTQSKNTTSP